MIDIRFRCGHVGTVSESMDANPRCFICGEPHVVAVQTKRPPRFVGACSGPYAESKALDAAIVNVAPGGPLLK
jgi:hypothetical protein